MNNKIPAACSLILAAAACGGGGAGKDAGAGDGVDALEAQDTAWEDLAPDDAGEDTDECEGHCTNAVQDCGEEYIDCGGECPPCSQNRASFVSQIVPASVAPGSRFEARITMRNDGTSTWSPEGTEPWRLGSWNPQDNDAWGTGRINIEPGASVPPGDTYEFTNVMTAPAAEGDYDFQWRMVQELVEWFGEPSENLVVSVEGPSQYEENPYSFPIDQPVPGDRGGMFVHDLDGDGRLDFVVTGESHVGACDHYGTPLWTVTPGIKTSGQYPGLHHPGAIAGDLDGDGDQEVAYITPGEVLRILDGVTGSEETVHEVPGAQAAAVANLRGEGDREAVIQYSQTRLRAIRLDSGDTLWETDDYISVEHSPLRQSDLDGDGLDEIAGLTFIDDDGSLMNTWDLSDRGTNLWNVDSIAVADIAAGGPLEAALAEQGGNNEAIAANHESILYGSANPDNPCCEVAGECRERDCDKVAVGEFSTDHPGLEVFCRSACGRAPWVFDAGGAKIAQWAVDDTSPEGWYIDGIDEVSTIDWNGDEKHEILAKERHVAGDAAVIDPMTGAFIHVFPASSERAYAVDLSGDPREEVVILESDGTFNIYWNEDPPEGVLSESPWNRQHYRRQKQNWNYYSP